MMDRGGLVEVRWKASCAVCCCIRMFIQKMLLHTAQVLSVILMCAVWRWARRARYCVLSDCEVLCPPPDILLLKFGLPIVNAVCERESRPQQQAKSEVLLCFGFGVYWEGFVLLPSIKESCLIVWEFEGGPQTAVRTKSWMPLSILTDRPILFLEHSVCFIPNVIFKAVEMFMGLPHPQSEAGVRTHSSAFRHICCLFVLHKPKGQNPQLSGTFIS